MMKGIKVQGEKIFCAECNQIVSKDGTQKLNFCPKCGNALNIDSQVKLDKQIGHEKLVMLYEILDTVNEGNDAVETIENFVNELEKL